MSSLKNETGCQYTNLLISGGNRQLQSYLPMKKYPATAKKLRRLFFCQINLFFNSQRIDNEFTSKTLKTCNLSFTLSF